MASIPSLREFETAARLYSKRPLWGHEFDIAGGCQFGSWGFCPNWAADKVVLAENHQQLENERRCEHYIRGPVCDGDGRASGHMWMQTK